MFDFAYEVSRKRTREITFYHDNRWGKSYLKEDKQSQKNKK